MNIKTPTNPKDQLVKVLTTLCKQAKFWIAWNHKSSFKAPFVVNDVENLKSDKV
jgi:hypothetical protein